MRNPKLALAFAFVMILSGTHSAFATVRKCGSDSCRDDAKIALNVQELLDSHPEFGPPRSILVQSVNHVVYLRGMVSTGLEKWTAESAASQAPDVARVVNSIVESN
jgi:osmotically-inducible protein OsmY